jgi:hypothetical protein
VLLESELDSERVLADLMRVVSAHDDCDADGWCTGCLQHGYRRLYPCPARLHLERAVDAVAARLGVTAY